MKLATFTALSVADHNDDGTECLDDEVHLQGSELVSIRVVQPDWWPD